MTPVFFLTALALLAPGAGCDHSSQPAAPSTSPATQAAEQPPKLTLIRAETQNWPSAKAGAMLSDPQDGLSAAVRLVRLSGLAPLCVPEHMTDTTASKLRLAHISDELWALGLADSRNERILHAPVLLTRDGAVVDVAGSVEEELLCLHLAQDADVFPHLLISPRRVWVVQSSSEQALALATPDCVGFCWRQQRAFPYVALVGGQTSRFAEFARYVWDPYELAFTGPAMDKLPDPPGGEFELDMPKSPSLIPMGGEIPAPKPIPQQPPPAPGDDLAVAPAGLKPARLKVEPTGAARYGTRAWSRQPSLADASAQEITSSGELPCWQSATFTCM